MGLRLQASHAAFSAECSGLCRPEYRVPRDASAPLDILRIDDDMLHRLFHLTPVAYTWPRIASVARPSLIFDSQFPLNGYNRIMSLPSASRPRGPASPSRSESSGELLELWDEAKVIARDEDPARAARAEKPWVSGQFGCLMPRQRRKAS